MTAWLAAVCRRWPGGSRRARLLFPFIIHRAMPRSTSERRWSRSGAGGATWSELDLDNRLWTIPAERMKGGAEHRVPLSDAALAVLEQARPLSGGEGLIFPSPMKPGQPMSDMTLTKVLRSTSSPSASTGGSTRSTPSAHCSASRATPLAQPMPSFTRESGGTQHVAVMGVNRIGKPWTTHDPLAVGGSDGSVGLGKARYLALRSSLLIDLP